MKYSVIDVSSSSLSLIVAAADEHKTEILFKERYPISLVHYLDGRRFTERGIDKLVDCLKEMKTTCRNFGAERNYLISTAALRYIENFDEVSRRVKEETGFAVNFIDAVTEAYCDYVANVYYASYERPVLIDLGGKSIEVCDLAKRRKEDMTSMAFGLLDLYRKFVSNIFPDEKEARLIKAYVKDKFDRAELPREGVYSTAVMVGAANAAIYDVYADYANVKAEGGVKVIEYKKFKKLVKHLLTGADRSKLVLNNAPEKLYLIGSAAVVLKVLFKRFGVNNIIVSDRGVKEGFLQLVLEGKETGLWYDFATDETGGKERAVPQENVKPEKKAPAKEKKSSAKKNAGEKKATMSADKAEKAEDAAPVSEGKAEKDAPVAAPKRRGRPPKTSAATMSGSKAKKAAPKASGAPAPASAPKRRGRPPKAAQPAPSPAPETPSEPSDEQ